jgi:hypothetical protein
LRVLSELGASPWLVGHHELVLERNRPQPALAAAHATASTNARRQRATPPAYTTLADSFDAAPPTRRTEPDGRTAKRAAAFTTGAGSGFASCGLTHHGASSGQ